MLVERYSLDAHDGLPKDSRVLKINHGVFIGDFSLAKPCAKFSRKVRA